MKWQWMALCAALGMPLACPAGEDSDAGAVCEAAYAELPHGTVLDLLDPEAPADRRAGAVAAYERLATLEACPEFGYTLGQLYRHGPYLAGNLVPQDVAKARELIRPMAEDGYLPAFADLAEMEMRHANTREAMKWTQVYLHFVQNVQADYVDDADARRYMSTAYNSHLLARTDFLWRRLTRPPLPRELVDEDLAAYLAERGDHVTRRMRERLEGQHRRASAQDGGPTGVAGAPDDCYLKPINRIGSASAAWIVEVLPSGETGRIVVENFVPSADVTRELERCLSRYTFAPFEGTRAATVRVSMVMGSLGGRALRRPRGR
jgi:TPR repeat protein